MKFRFLSVSLIYIFLVTSCGSSSNTSKTNVDEAVNTKESIVAEDNQNQGIENQNVNNDISNVNEVDSSTGKGDTIDVDPVFYDKYGNEVQLSDFKGKPIVLNFWTSWCTPCQYELADFQKSYEQYGSEVEFIIVDLVGVKGETEELAKAEILKNNYTFPVYFDLSGELLYSLVITEIPTTIFINSDGTILSKEVGLLSEKAINENIEQLIQTN